MEDATASMALSALRANSFQQTVPTHVRDLEAASMANASAKMGFLDPIVRTSAPSPIVHSNALAMVLAEIVNAFVNLDGLVRPAVIILLLVRTIAQDTVAAAKTSPANAFLDSLEPRAIMWFQSPPARITAQAKDLVVSQLTKQFSSKSHHATVITDSLEACAMYLCRRITTVLVIAVGMVDAPKEHARAMWDSLEFIVILLFLTVQATALVMAFVAKEFVNVQLVDLGSIALIRRTPVFLRVQDMVIAETARACVIQRGLAILATSLANTTALVMETVLGQCVTVGQDGQEKSAPRLMSVQMTAMIVARVEMVFACVLLGGQEMIAQLRDKTKTQFLQLANILTTAPGMEHVTGTNTRGKLFVFAMKVGSMLIVLESISELRLNLNTPKTVKAQLGCLVLITG